jgi:hypothetical protein
MCVRACTCVLCVLCVVVCVFVCVCVCARARMCVHIGVSLQTLYNKYIPFPISHHWAIICQGIHACTNVCKPPEIKYTPVTSPFTHTHTHTSTHKSTYTHTYTHIHTHAKHTHTQNTHTFTCSHTSAKVTYLATPTPCYNEHTTHLCLGASTLCGLGRGFSLSLGSCPLSRRRSCNTKHRDTRELVCTHKHICLHAHTHT